MCQQLLREEKMDKNKSEKVAKAVANTFLVEIGRQLVRNNRDRSRRRFLRLLNETVNGGLYETRDCALPCCNDRNDSDGNAG